MFSQFLKSLLICSLALVANLAIAGNNTEERKMVAAHGKVVDGSNFEGLAGVLVEVEGTDIKVYTDFEVNFTLPALPEGKYTLKSTYVSYNEVRLRDIKVSASDASNIEMRLHQS